MLSPAVPQVDGQEAAPHAKRAGGVRGRGAQGGAAEGAGERGRGEGPSRAGRECDRGRERRREEGESPASCCSCCCSCCSCSSCSASTRHQGPAGQQIDAAPGGREHPGDEGDARGRREGAGGGGSCFLELVEREREKKKRSGKESERHGRLVASRAGFIRALRGLFRAFKFSSVVD